jgi:Flp pilus assembly protein TadD
VRSAREKNDRLAMEKLAREVDIAEEPPEALFVLARGLIQRGADAAALALLRRAQQAFPGDFWINHDLGIALIECQPPQPEEAIRFLSVAVALRPDSPGVRKNLGIALARAERRDEAVVAYRQAITLKADFSMAHNSLGLVLGEQGHLDEAITAFRRAIEFKPDDADFYCNLGIFLARTDRLDEAVIACRKAIALEPDHAESHCNLGIALWQQGKLAQALTSLERGHELGSQRKDWHFPSAEWVRACRRQLEVAGRPR